MSSMYTQRQDSVAAMGSRGWVRFRFPILGHFSHQGDSYLEASLIQSFDKKKRRPMMPPSKFWMAVYPSMLKKQQQTMGSWPGRLSLDASLDEFAKKRQLLLGPELPLSLPSWCRGDGAEETAKKSALKASKQREFSDFKW